MTDLPKSSLGSVNRVNGIYPIFTGFNNPVYKTVFVGPIYNGTYLDYTRSPVTQSLAS